jgi:hypothetical protein
MTIWRPIEPGEDNDSDVRGAAPHGRRRSCRRAWRDGFAAETVINTLEDIRSYRAFERAIASSISPRSVIELELVHGLANLLWRLRRAKTIETGLLEIQSDFLVASGSACGSGQPPSSQISNRPNGSTKVQGSNGAHPPIGSQELLSSPKGPLLQRLSNPRAMAQCLLRLSNLNPNLLEQANAYEVKIWRQVAQTIWTLDALRQPPSASARPRFRKSVPRHFWDWEK